MMTAAAMSPDEPLTPREREKRLKTMRDLLQVPSGTQTWVANTMARVWDKIIMGNAFHALGVPCDEELLEKLRDLVLTSYPLLMEIFRSFCSKDGKQKNKETANGRQGEAEQQQYLTFLGFKTIIYHLNFECTDATDLLHLVYDRASSNDAKDFSDKGKSAVRHLAPCLS